MLTEAERLQAVETLLQAQRDCRQAKLLTDSFPHIQIEDSYAISTEVMKRKVAAGARLIGHKVGLTSKAMQASSKINEPDYGYLLDSMLIAEGAKVPHASFCLPRVEVFRRLATARRADRLAALAAEVPVATLAGDLTLPDVREGLVREAVARFGGVDVLVAAAGSGAVGPFAGADPQTLRRVMDIDFFAPVELVRVALPDLAAGRDPAIVLVGSILGLHPLPLHADYCAAKAAIHAFAGALRAEVAAEGIGVLLATLGPTASEFWENLLVGSRPSWSRGRPLDAETTAAAVLAALERRRAVVYPGWSAKGFAIAARFFPRTLDRIIRRRMARG